MLNQHTNCSCRTGNTFNNIVKKWRSLHNALTGVVVLVVVVVVEVLVFSAVVVVGASVLLATVGGAVVK